MITDYHIVSGSDSTLVSRWVSERLVQGWTLHEGVKVTRESNTENNYRETVKFNYTQVLVRSTPPPDERFG